jgi:hypothetical protein
MSPFSNRFSALSKYPEALSAGLSHALSRSAMLKRNAVKIIRGLYTLSLLPNAENLMLLTLIYNLLKNQ